MADVRRVLLHLEDGERYAVMDTDNGFYLYLWSFEDLPVKAFTLKDYLALAVKDFARFNNKELEMSYAPISRRDLNLVQSI